MRKFCEENERTKRAHLAYLRDAKGQDEKSLDKVAAALLKFEESTNYKPFKKFHIDQAGKFKVYLDKARNPKTGKPLSHATKDATLRMVKALFHWLAGQSGYKSRISYSDTEYFNNNAKDARVAHAQRDIPYPSMQQAAHAFQAMPEGSELERRDKALFAFLMLTGARDGAVASLRLKHINLFDGSVFQDARQVKTKNAKTFTTTFFQVGTAYLDCFENWVKFLRDEKLFGPEDALFPKPLRELRNGQFMFEKLSRETYSSPAKFISVIRNAFAVVQLPEYTPHSFRKTLGHLMNERCNTLEEQKAWSLNLGHENLATTVSAYMPISPQRQAELIKNMIN